MGLEQRVDLVGPVRVLDPGARERVDHAAVHRGVGRVVDDGAGVVALEVDAVDRARLGELRDELVGP
jgi:hypothetical protein